MNRQEYLNQIQNKLQGCDAEFIAEITRDLNEHFEQGIQNGKTEQEISETLGDISEWVDEMKANYAAKQLPATVCELPDKVSKVTVKTSYVDIALDSDSDEISWELNDSFSKLNIHNYEVKESYYHGRLTLEVVQNTKNQIGFQISSPRLLVHVPQGMDEIRVETHSADIDINDCDALDIKLAAKSGDISVEDCRGNIWIKNQSGDISVESEEAEKIVLETSSGDIDVEVDEVGSLSAKSTSGEIEIKVEDCNELFLTSISGDIEFEGKAAQVKISSTSGDVELEGELTELIWIETVSGDVNIELNDCDGIEGTTTSCSGDIVIDLNEVVFKNEGSFKWKEGDTEVAIKTVSGDIKIKRK